jgi:amidohydrolase family protein
MRKLFPILGMLLCLCVPGWGRGKPSEKIVVITNVNIVDVYTGVVQPRLVVVIRSGRITAIARHALIEQSPNIVVVNGEGKYLIPGLWDMHVHLAQTASGEQAASLIFPLLIANGVTGVRDMSGDPQALKLARTQVELGMAAGPRIIFSGPMPANTAALALHKPEKAAAEKAPGGSFLSAQSLLPREAPFASPTEYPGRSAVAGADAELQDAAEAEQRSEEHLRGLLEACSSQEEAIRRADAEQQKHPPRTPEEAAAYAAARRQLLLASYDPQKAADLFYHLALSHTWEVPTLVFLDQFRKWAGAAESVPDPDWRYLPPVEVQAAKAAAQAFRQGRDAASLAGWTNFMQRQFDLVGAMHQAGVGVLAGTDSVPGVAPGFALHRELRLLVEAGLTPLQALQAATLSPARFFGKEKEMGQVEVGKQADLVLLDADPTADIRNLDKIAGVVAAGRYYSRRDLDQMLEQAEAAAQQAAGKP